MKVLLVNGSPHKSGCTNKALDPAGAGKKHGVVSEAQGSRCKGWRASAEAGGGSEGEKFIR
ncbi:MAG: hypothetical protein IJ109_10720 [Firmicutes bacterium]|nr:hypothetical protein [Bacillota bacterium]MBQ9016569.1 hypothetical protein [Bacillota bacterium]